jgi:hypothetical protein
VPMGVLARANSAGGSFQAESDGSAPKRGHVTARVAGPAISDFCRSGFRSGKSCFLC